MMMWAFAVVASAKENVVMPSSLGGRGKLRSRVAQTMQLWYREAKALTSSDFEAALLKSTRPDEEAPKLKHVDSIVASIAYFDSYASPDCDPYSLLLHKIWSRLVEASPYTVVKAIYIYRRCLLPHPALSRARKVLAKRRASKSNTLYFDEDAVLDVKSDLVDAALWRALVARYWAYVDAAWLVCAGLRDNHAVAPVSNLADAATHLLHKASRVLFDKQHKPRTLPSCDLIDVCAAHILRDILAFHLILFLCASCDPAATLAALGPDGIVLLRHAADAVHRHLAPDFFKSGGLQQAQTAT